MQPAFLPQTALTSEQARCNFTMFDNPVLDLLSSAEAEKACSKMLLIYTRLKRADWRLWERPGVLYFGGDDYHTAWESLCELCGVASATLAKALKWMAERKVIAYFARKNGAGIRIYFNLALNSIKPKQKNLRLVPTSSGSSPASFAEAPSCDNGVITKIIQDSDLDAARAIEPPAAENTSNVVAGVADNAAPVAPTKPTLQLVPPTQSPPSAELQIAIVETLSRQIGELRQEVRDGLRALPSKDFMLGPAAGKSGRVSAETVLRVIEQTKPTNAYVGAAQPSEPPAPRPPVVHSKFWQEALREIAERVNEQSVATWFAPLNAHCRDDVAVITVPNEVFRDWLENNYADVLDAVGLQPREWEVVK